MFRISHLDRKTNVEVLEMAKVKQTLLRTIQERKIQYFGHLIREKGTQKTTDGRKYKRVKMQRRAKKDLGIEFHGSRPSSKKMASTVIVSED